jgi:UDP-glucose 4-epimerase
MNKVLVTGGAGFVGSNLISNLLQSNYSIINIDNFSNGLKGNLHSAVINLESNLHDSKWMNELAGEKIDAVIHCAAQSSNAISFKSPARDLLDNQLSTLNVIKFCESQNIKRLIFTSSMSAYGSPTVFPTPTSSTLNPLTYYGIHKSTSEQYIRLNDDLNWTIFRLYTTYGFGQNLSNSSQGLVSIFINKILRDEVLEIHGSTSRERDIIHVTDVVKAIHSSIENRLTFKKIYNLGTGKSITIKEILSSLLIDFGKSPNYPISETRGDVGDPFKTQADISSTVQDLGWEPQVTSEIGLRITCEKYLSS